LFNALSPGKLEIKTQKSLLAEIILGGGLEIKDRIRKLRIEKGLSFTQLATLFDKSEAAVRSWESGRTRPDTDTLIKLCEYFGVGADYMLGIEMMQEKPGKTEEAKKIEEYDGLARALVAGFDSLDMERRALALDICAKLLDSVKELDGLGEAQNVFASSLYSLLMDLSMCAAILSSVFGDGGGSDAGSASAAFTTIRNISDMDYRSMWDKLEEAFYSKVPMASQFDVSEFLLGREARRMPAELSAG
jgi:transcriptional regulator with XRE-family HTH domain